jgi:hypothetical protein
LGSGTKAGQGRRRALVATFQALGMPSDTISDTMGVPLRTVQDDLKKIREGQFFQKLPQELKAEVDGVASFVLAPVVALLDHKEPSVRIAAAHAIWTTYKEKVLLQQTLGLVPKEPEPLADTAAKVHELLVGLSRYLTPPAAEEFARAVKAFQADDLGGLFEGLLGR